MNKSELKLFLRSKNKGLILAPGYRLSLKDSFKNLCLVSPTGSGKTTRFVVGNILQCSDNVVVTDPSGELFKLTSGHMQKRGYKVQVLAPDDPDHSARFNPLHRFQSDQELKQVATTLGLNSAGKGDAFWITSAINIMFICLTALSNMKNDSVKNLANLRWMLNNYGVDGENIKKFMSNYLDEKGFAEYKAFCAQDSKVIASILSSARAALDLWSDPEIGRLTATDNIDLESLRDGKTIIYIIIPEHKIKYFSLVANLFYSACFEFCMKTPGQPVFFFLDEFGNLGKINNFEGISTVLRKKECSLNVILQELSQLEAIYGKHAAKAIYSGGCANKLFYSGLDLETCQYIEKSLGTITKYDTTFGGFPAMDKRAQTIASPLLSADKIRMLSKNEGILLSGSELPVKIKMPAFFQYKPWLKLSQTKPVKLDYDYSGEKVEFIDLH
ncbi:MAG: type IV secretory system conjugative DNA transfer family protein [Desulfobacteraceae bacterium]|nr:type IV secretory system conjugative DNA transfer family protein [Desulfobacteraceae bacterium]MBC2756282.1 type IV secretory system conjugative DNA transfer family protein [Desulfobacteraceae bacterium]